MKKKRLKSKVIKEEDKKRSPKKATHTEAYDKEVASPVCFANSPELRDEFK